MYDYPQKLSGDRRDPGADILRIWTDLWRLVDRLNEESPTSPAVAQAEAKQTTRPAQRTRSGPSSSIDTSGYEEISHKLSAWQSTPDNDHYPSEKLAKDTFEDKSLKVTAWRSQCDDDHYPSEKVLHDAIDYIGANFKRRDVLIYDKTGKLHVDGTITSGTDSADGLLNQAQGEGTQRDINSWNITGMDLSPFKSLRVVCRRNNANYASTPEFHIPLDGDPAPTRNIYVSGATVSTYGDRNRLQVIVCAVDSAKTKFCVTQALTMYGTAVTASSDMYVERIYGCY